MKKFFSISKIAMLAILFILLLGINSLAATNSVRRVCYYRTLGDLDGNGTVDSGDARLIMRASIGLEKLNFEQQCIADMNKDGQIDSADARLAMRGEYKGIVVFNFIPGDINRDGQCDQTDARQLSRYFSGLIKFNLFQKATADVNGDGELDSADARLISRKQSGLIKAFPIEGDITGNGTISKKDANLVLQYSVKKVTFTDAQKTIADVNRDGKIDSADARVILRRATALE